MSNYNDSVSYKMALESGMFFLKGSSLKPIPSSGLCEYFGHDATHYPQAVIIPANRAESIALKIGGSDYDLAAFSEFLGYNIRDFYDSRPKPKFDFELHKWFADRSHYFINILYDFPILEKMFFRGNYGRWKATYVKPLPYSDSNGNEIKPASYIAYTDKAVSSKGNRAFFGKADKGKAPKDSPVPIHVEFNSEADFIIICDSAKDIPAYLVGGYDFVVACWGVGNLTKEQIDFLIMKGKPVLLVADSKDIERKCTFELGRKLQRRNEELYKEGKIANDHLTVKFYDFSPGSQNGFDATDALNQDGKSALEGLWEKASLELQFDPNCDKKVKKINPFVGFDGLKLNIMGNALRFLSLYKDDILYVRKWDQWLIWNGKYWEKDEHDKIRQLGRNFFEKYTEIALEQIYDEEERDYFLRFLVKSEDKLTSIIEETKHFVSVLPSQLEQDEHLLCVKNGTIDLKTGKLQSHNKLDYITRMIPLEYDNKANSPEWEKFIMRIFPEDSELWYYLQRMFGYAATAERGERCFHILIGSGSNGKSVLLNTIKAVLGPYSGSISPTVFYESHKDKVQHELAQCWKVRYLVATEPSENSKLDESKIKTLSDDSEVFKARFLFKHEFELEPTFKIFIGTNYMPKLKGSADGPWDRLRMIRFPTKISKKEKIGNYWKHLYTKEGIGILNWIVQGAKLYYQNGLEALDKINALGEEAREDSDYVQHFLMSVCERDPSYKVPAGTFYHAAEKWINENEGLGNNRWSYSAARFKQNLYNKGINHKKQKDGNYFIGVRVKSEYEMRLFSD